MGPKTGAMVFVHTPSETEATAFLRKNTEAWPISIHRKYLNSLIGSSEEK